MRDDVQQIVNTVSGWDGIERLPHRFGGVEFSLNGVEVGHIHANGMVDIPFTRRIREQLVDAGEAGLHHLLRESGWITFYVRRPEDIEQAVKLYRLSYLHKRYRRAADRADDTFAAALDALDFSAAVKSSLFGRAAEADEQPDDAADPEET
jgi:hypothetical protein